MRVLVTGGAAGLGASLAAAYRERGADVVVGDVAPVEGGLRLDVRSDDDWIAALAWVTEHWGGLDVLVNNAGVAGGGRVDVATMDEWEWITQINLFGVVRGTRTFVPMMKAAGTGTIVNIASLAGFVHPAGMGSYNAVKAGVVAFTETISHELAGFGIRTAVVCPSYFRTGLLSSLQGADTALAATMTHLVENAPLGPDDIAAAVLEGIDRGDEIILPDPAARAAYELKRDDRPAYDAMMRAQAARLAAAGGRMSCEPTGEALAVRDEDAFDVAAVRSWLAGHGVELDDVEVRQFPGGASNLTYQLGDHLILRRPPAGRKAKGAHDMGREYRIQSALAEPFGLVPEMVAFCDDESVIGSEFYVMERVDGLTPRRELGTVLSPAKVAELCSNVLDVLVRLHGVDAGASAELGALNKGTGYVRRQVEGWSTRWRQAVTGDVSDERAARAERVMAWLDEHQPDDVASAVIHNDFRFDNLVLDRDDPTRVLAVLDWELATVGDPLMDLGCTLAYWVQADDDEWFQQFRRQPTHLAGMMTRDELLAAYAERTGREIPTRDRAFYEAYGSFRLAGISQQIYYRYFHGQTTNEAYARFGPAADALEARCAAMLEV